MCIITWLLLGLGLYFAVTSAAPYPVLPSSLESLPRASSHSISYSLQKLAFKVPCAACLPSGGDVVLDFEIQHPPLLSSTNLCTVPFALNGQPITTNNDHSVSTTSLQVLASQWELNLTVQALCVTGTDIPQRAFFFNISHFDSHPLKLPPSFTAVLGHNEKTQVLVESAEVQKDCASALSSVVDKTSSLFTKLDNISEENDIKSSTDVNLTEQLLRRRLYEQAAKLHKLNEECRSTSQHQKLSDCNRDISCITKLMCERIHDTTSIHIAKIQHSLKQSVMVSKQRYDQYVAVDDNDVWDFNTTSFESLLADSGKDTKNAIESQHPLVVALEILAAAIGLAALYKFIHRRCCSLRRRVERLADREERDRARHFRCLARRQAMRKKWVSVKGFFKRSPRNGDYEEKRALIIESAGDVVDDHMTGPYDIDDPELGAVSDLRRAHEFVTAMITDRDQDIGQPFDTRTRSGSLPSYTNEKLPDYTSTDEHEYHVGNGRNYAASLAGSGSRISRASGITPDSSIVITPRCSRETLRTGTDISGD